MKNTLIALELAGMVALTCCVVALGNDAVSGPNGKVDAFAGSVDGNESENLSGSYAFPITGEWGAQFDGLYGRLDHETLYAGGGHLFWRNPELALLGLNASYGRWDKADLWRAGVEGELYVDSLTLAGQAGNQSSDFADGFYGNLGLRYYLAGGNLMLAATGSTFDHTSLFGADVEYLTELNGLSLFASGTIGENNYDMIIGGIWYYFGSDKPLMLRHREDDPFNHLFSSFNSTFNSFHNEFMAGRRFGDPDATPE